MDLCPKCLTPQRPMCPSPGVATKGRPVPGLMRRERPATQSSPEPESQLWASPGTFPGAARAPSPQRRLHAQQVPVDELGLQVVIERVIPLLQGHPRPGLVTAQIWGHIEGRVWAGPVRAYVQLPGSAGGDTEAGRGTGVCSGAPGGQQLIPRILSPGTHEGRAWELHDLLEGRRECPGTVRSRGGKLRGLCLGMSWPCHLLALQPWQRYRPLVSLSFRLHKMGYQTLPPSALGSPPHQ